MSTGPTVAASLAQNILRWASSQGVDRDHLVTAPAQAAIDAAGEHGRVPRALHDGLWQRLGDTVADPAFALKAAPEILSASSLGVVGMLAMTSGTVGESLQRSVRFSRILKDDLVVRLHETDDRLVIELISNTPLSRPIAEASLFAYPHFFALWSEHPVRPVAALFRHPRPADFAPYERFDCRVDFDQPTLAIVLERNVVHRPMTTAQPEVADYLEAVAQAALDNLADGRDMGVKRRVAHYLRGALTTSAVGLVDVARDLHMSPRSLQRALAEAGVSYRELLDEVRWSVRRTARRLDRHASRANRRALGLFRWKGLPPRLSTLGGAAPSEWRRQKR